MIMNLRRDVFQAIADPTRRAILILLSTQAMTAGAIAVQFDTARPTVSKHLQILTECELLQRSPRGREMYYLLNPVGMREVSDFIEPFRKFWDDKFNSLENVMKNYHEDRS
jgi:DNA-binding transcriptional ArsR family regulator